MTKEELEKKAEEYQTGRKDLNYFSEPYKDKIRKAYIAGAKENGIVWHDLRRNPDDLPNDDRDVINERGMFVWCRDGVWYESDVLMKIRAYPVAWCEIPSFEAKE